MNTTLEWPEIGLRLLLTIIGGALIGLNRGERGHAAGLCTTLLVCLAASVSMIQVNLLLGVAGKAKDSFVVLDLMRLPLGILTGVGFIGGGAILKKENIVMGVTTAATLWFVTVMGLCFGGGQLALGLTSFGIAFLTLSLLKKMEQRLDQDRRAVVKLKLKAEVPSNADLKRLLQAMSLHILSWNLIEERDAGEREVSLVLKRTVRPADLEPPDFLQQLLKQPGVAKIEWHDLGA
ncbi:MAG TPA: MgtC/SapB family protein [Chthoniobacter sp.]